MSKASPISLIPSERIEGMIYVIRGQKVILDQDLASLYDVETKALNQAFQRNVKRFPKDFAFQLTLKEEYNLKSQFVTSSSWGGRRKPPRAFTEHGVVMLANLLKSERAIAISVEIIRAFIKLREFLSSQKEMAKEVSEIKSFLLKYSNSTDREFRKVWQAIDKLASPPNQDERRIGFELE